MGQQPRDTSDEAQVKQATLLTELEDKYRQEAIRLLLSSYGGRAFIRDILTFCGMDAMAPSDPNQMIRFQGRRDVGLLVQKQCLTADRDAYSLIAEEFESTDIEDEYV